ncbi:MAG: FAD-dependent oxidoreductase, partial [Candidatus Margulisbacteria bacterium]|nr:FAD-dependent oxidoreductase [Candidatus Margulisiibacteriota bacterium]
NEEEKNEIEKIYQNCLMIGVPGISLLPEAEVKKLEPNIFALTGIMSATTGIIDSHGLMKYYYQQALAKGALFAFNHEVSAISKQPGGYLIEAANGEKVLAERVINAAGLGSEQVARLAGFDVKKLKYTLYPCKGDYFSIPGAKGKLNHLVYPVPHKKGYGLGVHATLDLTGQIRLGPDAHYGENLNYDVDPAKRLEFYQAAKTYLPWLKEAMLSPDTSGIRPKLQGPDDGFRDFVIKEESANGCPGFINLIGIESPGLTASPAIAQMVKRLMMTSSD